MEIVNLQNTFFNNHSIFSSNFSIYFGVAIRAPARKWFSFCVLSIFQKFDAYALILQEDASHNFYVPRSRLWGRDFFRFLARRKSRNNIIFIYIFPT